MKKIYSLGICMLALLFVAGCAVSENEKKETRSCPNDGEIKTATFAGGCFWCVEAPFQKVDGILSVVSGFAGGEIEDPEYEAVASGATKHVEAVQIEYDSSCIDYEDLLDIFWRQINPFDGEGQFADRGFQYSTAIFYHDEEQKQLAEASKEKVEELFGDEVLTRIVPYTTFFPAEEYHQDFFEKNPVKYNAYKVASGRAGYINEQWGDVDEHLGETQMEKEFTKPSEEELKKMLTPLQYKVTQKDGTEKAFENEYWDNKEEGIYVDLVSGEPLFSSTDKFKSGTGWPSFTKPLDSKHVVTKKDYKLIVPRTEVRSKNADSHLGHVFNDGPAPTGMRYCINSAALRFVPKDKMEEEGYGDYLYLFE